MSELWKLSATGIAGLVASGDASAAEVTRDALARLDAVNPAINAVVQTMHEQALERAGEIDARLARGENPGPLAGVPVTVKVNVDQSGFATTNGLRLQRDLLAEHSSPVVDNLLRAGAVVIGRTNTPAFSLRWFTRNSLHGHTRNPRNPALTPGGSSGGAAAALTAGIGAIAHGTDIGGSIRYPAYACGIHGLRPSLGRVPAVNLSGPDRQVGAQLMAVSGPLARTIGDLELALTAMSAADHRDPWWVPAPLDLPFRRGPVALCIAPDGMSVQAEVATALEQAARRLEDAGWPVEEVPCPSFREAARLQGALWMAEFRRGAGDAVAREDDPDAVFVHRQLMRHCAGADADGALDALQGRLAVARRWQEFLQQYPLLLCPVSGELPFDDQLDVVSEDAFDRVIEAQLTQLGLPLLGLPGLTVSTGMAGERPVGVQLVAGRFRENLLLAAGAVIEAGGAPPSPIDPVVAE